MAANITEPAANTTTIVPINGTWEDFMIANFNFLGSLFLLQYSNKTYVFSSGLVIAGLVWGITNPFLEKGSKDSTEEEFDLSLKSLLKTIFNYKFIIPFVINQLGSIIYYYFLGKSCNTISFPYISWLNCHPVQL